MKRQRWGLLLALLLASGAHGAVLYGDADGNGSIGPSDVLILARVAGGLAPIDDVIRRNGDVAPVNDYDGGSFGDGKITLLDAARISRKVAGLSTPEWPATASAFLLEPGNRYVTRQYDSTGTALTGPGTAEPDVITLFSGPMSETVGGVTYNNVFLASSSDGDVQHLIPEFDAGNTPTRILATVLTLGSNPARFDPPLVALKYPLQNGTAWNGVTTATDVESGATLAATYEGSISGPVTITMADGTNTFDDAFKVTLSYNAGPLLYGAEYYWFVPFIGPVQHGYTRTALFQTSTVNPDYRLVSADVHGVLYP